jgi:thiol-disulfide isomerase/thioredoxin
MLTSVVLGALLLAPGALPALDIRDTRGKKVDLAKMSAERPVLVEFWATWCGTCRKMAPMLRELFEARSGKWDYLTVSIDTDANALRKYIEKDKTPWPILFDPRGEAAQAWKVTSVPAFFVVQQGKITWKRVGLTDRSAFERALGVRVEAPKSSS